MNAGPLPPAVQRRRHSVPAPHRDRPGYRSFQNPLQGGGHHGQFRVATCKLLRPRDVSHTISSGRARPDAAIRHGLQ